jgi:myo-inositol-1(or 4)-monophosphatase
MEKDVLEKHLRSAIVAARSAGAMVLDRDKRKQFQVEQKHLNDYVTDADKASEELIISQLKDQFPTESFFGEEGGRKEDGKGRWVIDPIDGTTNFFRGVPNYVISIAWEMEPHKPVVGVVFNPRQDEMFVAMQGGGAKLNGMPIHVSSISDPARSLIVCVPPHRHHELADGYFALERSIFNQCSDIRSLGSCALELCYIAAGRFDGYYELSLGYYDLAAGMIILQEAGGVLESIGGIADYHCDLLASNGALQPWLRTVVPHAR